MVIRKLFKLSLILILISILNQLTYSDDGYRLWLKYDKISDTMILNSYKKSIKAQLVIGNSATCQIIKNELSLAFKGLFGETIPECNKFNENMLIVARQSNLPHEIQDLMNHQVNILNDDGFLIKTLCIKHKIFTIITAENESGLLDGVFKFIRLLQNYQDINRLHIFTSPKIKLRLSNHWDNLDRTVERGYAGFSLWDWHKLPDYIHPYYIDYARANASIGLNGTVLNNVNANAQILTPLYLKKVVALADVFRPYRIKVYLSIRFSAPIDIGGLNRSSDQNIPNYKY